MTRLPSAPLAAVQASPLDAVVHAAARKMLGLRMARVVGEPDKADADNLIADLDALCDIIDPVILAIGEYARETLGVSQSDIKDYFTDQLRSALEGNAMFCIESAVRERIEASADTEADLRRGIREAV